jgi:hypothetical protein
MTTKINFLTRKVMETVNQKGKKGGKNPTACLTNREAGHSIGTALLQSITKTGTRSTMKSNRKVLQEFSPHIPQIPPKVEKCRSTNKMLHADMIVRTKCTRVRNTHTGEATNYHQKSPAINQLSRRRRQPVPIL